MESCRNNTITFSLEALIGIDDRLLKGVCVCVCGLTCQQAADRQVYGHLVLGHLVSEGVHTVTCQTQADGLLAVREAPMALTERAQTLPVSFDQHTLLTNTHTQTVVSVQKANQLE